MITNFWRKAPYVACLCSVLLLSACAQVGTDATGSAGETTAAQSSQSSTAPESVFSGNLNLKDPGIPAYTYSISYSLTRPQFQSRTTSDDEPGFSTLTFTDDATVTQVDTTKGNYAEPPPEPSLDIMGGLYRTSRSICTYAGLENYNLSAQRPTVSNASPGGDYCIVRFYDADNDGTENGTQSLRLPAIADSVYNAVLADLDRGPDFYFAAFKDFPDPGDGSLPVTESNVCSFDISTGVMSAETYDIVVTSPTPPPTCTQS